VDQWTRAIVEGPIGMTPIEWWDWLDFNMKYREAKALISGTPPAADPRLNVVYGRALAAITQGDANTFMQAGREQVQRKAWDLAAGSFSKVLDQLTPGFRASSDEMRMCVAMVQQPEVFDALIKLRPDDPRVWYARGRLSATRGKWADAIPDFTKTLKLYRDEWTRAGRSAQGGDWSRSGRAIGAVMHDLAALHVLAGNQPSSGELWELVNRAHEQINDFVAAQLFSRACILVPDAMNDWSIPLRLAEPAVAKQPRVAWHLFTLGAAQYRAGKTEDAVESLKKSLESHPAWVGRGQNHAVLAMACQRLGRRDEARDWLARGQAWLEETNGAIAKLRFGYATSDYLTDWLGGQVLLREAEKLVSD
jgi:tetratricopeptide (TPR) repeat protein